MSSAGWEATNSNKVSNRHHLQFWDVVYEWMATVIGFGFYLDLASIVGPPKAAAAAAAVNEKPAAKEEKKEEADGETEF